MGGWTGANLHRKELIALPRESAILLLLLLAIAAASFARRGAKFPAPGFLASFRCVYIFSALIIKLFGRRPSAALVKAGVTRYFPFNYSRAGSDKGPFEISPHFDIVA